MNSACESAVALFGIDFLFGAYTIGNTVTKMYVTQYFVILYKSNVRIAIVLFRLDSIKSQLS